MNNPTKTSSGAATKTKAGQNPTRAPARAQSQRGNRVDDVDAAINQAMNGKVNVTPAKAVEMAGKLYGQRKYVQAERVCRQLLAARPEVADAHNILGVTLLATGKFDEAFQHLNHAIKLNPAAPSYHANLGEAYRQAGRLDDAVAPLKAAIDLDPNNAQAFNNLGIIQFERRRFKDSIAHYRKAIEQRPSMAEAHNNLGNALRVVGDNDGAIAAYQNALVHRAVYPEVYNNLGSMFQQDRRLDEAEHSFRKAIQQNSKYVEAYNNLAQLYVVRKNDVEALRMLSEALKIAPRNVASLLLTAKIQLRRNALGPAEQAARLAGREDPKNAEVLAIQGQIYHETDRYEEAIEVLEKALEANPESAEARNFFGIALKSVGRLDEAREQIIQALKKNHLMYGAYANLNDLVDFSKDVGEELFHRMEAIFETVKNKEADFMLPLHFAFAKALDDRGEHAKALEHYIIGGKMKRRSLDYKEEETFEFFDSIRAAYPKEIFENRPFKGIDDDRFVFIVGMPRSGSTLLEQIVSSHPDVFGAGEVKYLSRSLAQLRDRFPGMPKYPEMQAKITPAQMGLIGANYQSALAQGAGDAKRITDKLLTNYFFIGLIALLFPKAKIINTMRDPVDTCLSGFTKLFKDDMPHSYDLTELGHYYGKYRELMNHWHEVLPEGMMTTVVYEDVVADMEGQARRIIDFLGLPWNDKCLEFHKSDRPVKTASVAQVRKPIYKSSVKRWAKYGDGLQPLVDAIEERPATEKASAPAKAKAPSAKTAAATGKAKTEPKAKPKSKTKAKAKESA